MASTNNHFWQRRPGLWRSLFTIGDAIRLRDFHSKVFAAIGYSLEDEHGVGEANTVEAIDKNWVALAHKVSEGV